MKLKQIKLHSYLVYFTGVENLIKLIEGKGGENVFKISNIHVSVIRFLLRNPIYRLYMVVDKMSLKKQAMILLKKYN